MTLLDPLMDPQGIAARIEQLERQILDLERAHIDVSFAELVGEFEYGYIDNFDGADSVGSDFDLNEEADPDSGAVEHSHQIDDNVKKPDTYLLVVQGTSLATTALTEDDITFPVYQGNVDWEEISARGGTSDPFIGLWRMRKPRSVFDAGAFIFGVNMDPNVEASSSAVFRYYDTELITVAHPRVSGGSIRIPPDAIGHPYLLAVSYEGDLTDNPPDPFLLSINPPWEILVQWSFEEEPSNITHVIAWTTRAGGSFPIQGASGGTVLKADGWILGGQVT